MTSVIVTPLSAAIREAQECLDQRRDGKLSTVCEKRLRRVLNAEGPDRLQIATQIAAALVQKTPLHYYPAEYEGQSDKPANRIQEIVRDAYAVADALLKEDK